MAVGLREPPPLGPVGGIRIGTAAAGIRYPGRTDLTLIAIAPGAASAAVFTRNAFCAAPVVVAREHLARSALRYLLINTGNANAGTGEQGLADARECCRALARHAGCRPEEVAPFSTGVIGEPLAVARLSAALPAALGQLEAGGWNAAARAIMTTDTVPKGVSRRFTCGGRTCTLTGIAKGAGMIRPDMATMLAFVATDAAVAPPLLQRCLVGAAARSFNRITVDGDTSTNDSCVLVATGAAGGPLVASPRSAAYRQLRTAVEEVCAILAQAVVRDAEGATRFITVQIVEGASVPECLRVGYAIAHSPLVKTAFFAGDPNWGRILAAVGRAGISGLAVERIRIELDDVCIVERGARAAGYREEEGQRVMREPEITLRVALGRGRRSATLWTCDFSYDYVKINAEYRS